MIQINTFNLYDLGQVLMRVKSLRSDSYRSEWFGALTDAMLRLESFLDVDPTVPLYRGAKIDITHSRRAGEDLLSIVEGSLNSANEVFSKGNQQFAPVFGLGKIGERIDNPELAKLTSPLLSAVRIFETNLDAELAEAPTYFISQVGIFSTKDLLSRAHKKLSEGSLKLCSQFVIDDVKMSGSCLAMHQFTACGFHALRAIEDIARKYSKKIVKTPRHKEDFLPLGPVINNLREQLELEESVKSSDSSLGLIIAYMVRVKNIFRNPIMHPEMVLEEDGAKEVFDLAFLIINAITRDLGGRGVDSLESPVS